MFFSKSTAAALAAAALPLAFAQTSTDCNPTEKSCSADTGLNTKDYYADFTQGESALKSWSKAAYTDISFGSDGAEFTIAKAGQAPTIQTDFYIFFGRVEVKMKAAPGTGIVSSVVFESDDLDEIDWEWVGGDSSHVQSDFFGKGNTTSYDRAQYHGVDDAMDTVHTYTVDWTSDRIEWSIDGAVVRTLSSDDALTVGGKNYPQTPMRIKLGNWAGGAPGQPEGTVEWAGGKTDFSKAPFTMSVESIAITNYNPSCQYIWGDQTGSWESIKLDSDCSGSSSGSASGGSSSSSSTTSAPTSAHSVVGGVNSGAIVPTTAISSGTLTKVASTSTGTGASSSATGATNSPGGGDSAGPNNGSGSSSGLNSTVSSGSPSSSHSGGSSASATPGANAAAIPQAFAAGSLLSVALAFFLL
ncbi:glycoside hydrolase family 16 protein [Polychaeton citri CBS 116435]|uniref:Crh-like protein n=1 Tax=Polychaeton citri CBS 116435 TaxID=1314669 RepID=A0A9P4USG6_9PEZI|nr:glycoside hydrolase family 16 protein [Polychaeton citri CBS 116435]